jgi:hypothetical protein
MLIGFETFDRRYKLAERLYTQFCPIRTHFIRFGCRYRNQQTCSTSVLDFI